MDDLTRLTHAQDDQIEISPMPIDEEVIAALSTVSQIASRAAESQVFSDYLARRALHTKRRQLADLDLFCRFIDETTHISIEGAKLQQGPQLWAGIHWGLVEAFKRWMILSRYSVGSVNVRLSTIKRYARLAMSAGAMTTEQCHLIRAVEGYNRSDGINIDAQRDRDDIPTRRGFKKAAATRLTPEQARALKAQPDSPQGRRDAVLMCFLLDHGLRVGELASLRVEHIQLKGKQPHFTFWRQKVKKEQTHLLTADTLEALKAWYRSGEALAVGPLLRGSRKGGELTTAGMNTKSITHRVRTLGAALGIPNLSAHDCRHFWASHAARSGTDAFSLQEAGGWSSLAMPRRYIKEAEVSNKGVKGFS